MRLRYPGSRSPFLKYLRWNQPCLRFEKAPEKDFCFFRRSLTSLGASRLVDAASPRNICIDKKKYPLEPRVRLRGPRQWTYLFDQVRESRFRNPWNVCFWNPVLGNFIRWNLESWVLESIIQLKESGVVLTIGIWNPSSIDKESGIQNPESETVLDYFTWG